MLFRSLRDQLDDNKASFAYCRVQYANDKESKREKFILVVWIGPGCKVMRKAKVCDCSLLSPSCFSMGGCCGSGVAVIALLSRKS